MQRHFSVGLSTLVALMAAHREAVSTAGPHAAALSQHSVAELHVYLMGGVPAREGESMCSASMSGQTEGGG